MSEKKSHGCLLGGLGCLAAIGLLAVLIVVVGVCVSDAPEPKVPSVQEATVDDEILQEGEAEQAQPQGEMEVQN